MRTTLLATFLAVAFAGAAAAEGNCASKNVTAQTTSTVQTAQLGAPTK